MWEVIYLLIGFVVGLLGIKAHLMKSGQGNCKMCKKCDYLLDFKTREASKEP